MLKNKIFEWFCPECIRVLYIESEVHNVAVLHYIFGFLLLIFPASFAGCFRASVVKSSYLITSARIKPFRSRCELPCTLSAFQLRSKSRHALPEHRLWNKFLQIRQVISCTNQPQHLTLSVPLLRGTSDVRRKFRVRQCRPRWQQLLPEFQHLRQNFTGFAKQLQHRHFRLLTLRQRYKHTSRVYRSADKNLLLTFYPKDQVSQFGRFSLTTMPLCKGCKCRKVFWLVCLRQQLVLHFADTAFHCFRGLSTEVLYRWFLCREPDLRFHPRERCFRCRNNAKHANCISFADVGQEFIAKSFADLAPF